MLESKFLSNVRLLTFHFRSYKYQFNLLSSDIILGHVDPNEINNEDPDAQDTTFTLTNVAPQASIFNGRAHQKDFLE